jgi:hypothetical protein
MPRYSVKVFPGVRVYGGHSRPRKPPPPIESLSRTAMIVTTVIAEALGIWLAVALFIMPASGSVSTGITILVVWNLVIAWKWLMWASKRNPTPHKQQVSKEDVPSDAGRDPTIAG